MIGAAMFGEDEFDASVRRLASDLGIDDRVEWRGFREDIGSELADLDVLVHCSIIPEPFGQVVVEGMAAALPVVSTDVGGPAEVIDHGRTGILVGPGDQAQLANALKRLIANADERKRMGSAAHEAAFAYRDVNIASHFDVMFRKLADSRRKTGTLTRRRHRTS